jgi:RimJ/RimL family protein N-acetyltransferase
LGLNAGPGGKIMCAVEVLQSDITAIGAQRLSLRAPVAADAPAIAELANDFGVAGMTLSMPYPYTLADAAAFVAEAGREPARFVIEHRQFGVIGGLGFNVHGGRFAELGYWLGRPFWGRGYASEAVSAALAWARDERGKRVVIAGHAPENHASGQVLIKAGFLYTGDVVFRPSKARGAPSPTRMMVWLA